MHRKGCRPLSRRGSRSGKTVEWSEVNAKRQIERAFRSFKRRNVFTILGITSAIIVFGAMDLHILDG